MVFPVIDVHEEKATPNEKQLRLLSAIANGCV